MRRGWRESPSLYEGTVREGKGSKSPETFSIVQCWLGFNKENVNRELLLYLFQMFSQTAGNITTDAELQGNVGLALCCELLVVSTRTSIICHLHVFNSALY